MQKCKGYDYIYFSASDSLPGDVLRYHGLPAIESIVCDHIVQFYRSWDVFSPAIILVIFKISHVFPRYRSIAGWHIKNRRWKHLFILFSFSRIFVIIEFWQIFTTACTPPPLSVLKSMFCGFFFLSLRWGEEMGTLAQRDLSTSSSYPSKSAKKEIKNYSRLLMYTTGIELKLKPYMCRPGIQWWAKLLRLLTVNSLSYFVKIKY